MPILTPALARQKFAIFIEETSAIIGSGIKIRNGRKLKKAMTELQGMSTKLSDDSLRKLREMLASGYDVEDMVRMLGNPNLEQAFTRMNGRGYLRNGKPLDHDQLVQIVYGFKDAPNAKMLFKRLKTNHDNVVGFVHEAAYADHIGATDLSLMMKVPRDHMTDADVVKNGILYQLKFYESTVLNGSNAGHWVQAAWKQSGGDISKVRFVVADLALVDKNSFKAVLKKCNVPKDQWDTVLDSMFTKYP